MNLLVLVAMAWLLGLAGGALIAPGAWQSIAALLALAAGVLVTAAGIRRAPPRFGAALLAVAAALSATLAAGVATGPPGQEDSRAPPAGLARLDATVEQVRYGPDERRARSVIRVQGGVRLEDSRPFPSGIRLAVEPTPLPEGARIKLMAQVRPWAPLRNPSPHPPLPRAVNVQGRGWIASPAAIEIVHDAGAMRWLASLRAGARRALEQTLPPSAAGLARALALGDAEAVDSSDQDAVRRAGLAHVLAVSGLHVTILVGLAVLILQRLLLYLPWIAARFEARRIAYAIGAPLSLAYAAFAGGAPSAWRAAATACVSWVLAACGRRPLPAATTAAAAILLGAIQPRMAVNPGFILSIAATAAVISASRVKGEGFWSWLKAAFDISFRATVATAPVILWCFGSLQAVGLIANVLLVPIGELLLIPLAALHSAVACASRVAAPMTGIPFTIGANAFVEACRVFSLLPLSGPLPPPDVPQGLVLAAAALLLLSFRSWRARATVCAIALMAVLVLELRLRAIEQPRGRLRVTFLEVGEGDASVVDLPDGRVMLIDAGSAPRVGMDTGRAVLLPLLRARRRSRVDIVVLTHPHPDHYGGLRAIVENLEIGELWDTGQAHAESSWNKGANMREAEELLTLAQKRGAKLVRTPELCNKPRRAGGATIEILWPCPIYDPGYDANDNSAVMRIEFKNQSFLFAGDIQTEAETLLVGRRANLKADVLKVSHHGSRTSSTQPFLAAVSPKLAVVSAGAFNQYGHPDPEVISRLQQAGARVVRLDQTGGVIIASDGASVK